jgi:hypothetical protein
MLTMAGNRMPMLVNTPGFNQANTQPPRLTEEEERVRLAVLADVRSFEAEKLKKASTDDKSLPVAEGICEFKMYT